MCMTKTVLVSLSLILLAVASFCKHQAYIEKELRQHSKLKSQGSGENDYKNHCLNSTECYYQVDEDTVGCFSFVQDYLEENDVKD